MSDPEQFLSDEEILARVSDFESEGFPPLDCIQYAEALAKYCRGNVAEEAVRRLVESFPDDRLNELVGEHVVPFPSPGIDYRQQVGHSLVAGALVNRGFNVVETGWRVGWPGGDVLEGEDLCRLALLAVWLRRMRTAELEG